MLPLDTLLHNRYLVEAQLGGGATPIYQALDLTTRAQVALQPLAEPEPGAAEQAAVLLALHHPHLPLAHDLIAAQGQRVLVLELVPADDLASLVQRHGRAPIELARRWVRQLFGALDYIHTLAPPLVHGAIEPAWIRIDTSSAPLLIGFGTARPAEPAPWSPPEPQPGPPGDVYALAATLYYALVGEPPAPAAERASALAQGRPDPLVAPRALDTRVPAALSNAIRQALALDPATRPTAAELLVAIDDLPQPVAVSQQPRQLPWRRILPAAAALLALLAIAFAFMRPGAAAPPATATPAALQSAATVLQITATPVPAATPPPPAPTALSGTNTPGPATAEVPTATIADIATASLQPIVEPTAVAAPASATPASAELAVMRGILPDYTYTGRVATDPSGAYTRMRSEANPASPPVGLLRNGDEIDILETSADTWLRVRIRTSADPAQIGTIGWIERWLIENQGVPAAPSPLVFSGRVYSTSVDAAVQCGRTFESSIYGSIEDARGVGIRGARVRVISADQRNVYTVSTGRGGVYTVPGLGCTTWTVRLLSVPGAPNGIQANVVTVRRLNGGKYTAAEVRYRLAP